MSIPRPNGLYRQLCNGLVRVIAVNKAAHVRIAGVPLLNMVPRNSYTRASGPELRGCGIGAGVCVMR